MGRTDEGVNRPVTRRSRLLVVRCAVCRVRAVRCFVTPLRPTKLEVSTASYFKKIKGAY